MLQGVKALVTMGMLVVEDRIPPPAHVTTDGPTRPGFCCFLPLSLTPCKLPAKKKNHHIVGEDFPIILYFCTPVNLIKKLRACYHPKF